jgi:hypothetical protein
VTTTRSAYFDPAIALFDTANAADPNRETDANGKEWPKELLYAHRMSEMLVRFNSQASEVEHLAVRAQHIERWKTPRDNYPMDRNGYLQWRTGLYKYHAETAGRLMREAGCDDAMIERVKMAVGKKGLKVNAESQTLEDIADLVFIEYYMTMFATKQSGYSEEKWLDIIRKTWKKMSERARAFALSGQVKLPEPLVPLITKAIQGA